MYLSIYRLPIYVLDNSLTKYHVMPTSAPSIYVDQINEKIYDLIYFGPLKSYLILVLGIVLVDARVYYWQTCVQES